MILTIGQIIAFPAPGVQQPNPLTCSPVKQTASKGETFGTTLYAVAGICDQFAAV